jgi:cytochrome c biogenesis protein CcdA
MLVTLSTVNSIEAGAVFIFVFGLGVILGMVGIACLVGTVMAYTATNLERVHKIIKAITGTASITFGVVIIVNALI